MGRYYSGDIQGKFWFAVQPSDAADRFGVIGQEPNYLDYWFTQDNLADVQAELLSIENSLGHNLQKLDEYFDSVDGYTDEAVAKHLGVNLETAKSIIKEYADYHLGKKIEKAILENGECSFTAEL